jgi:hypothetical protein
VVRLAALTYQLVCPLLRVRDPGHVHEGHSIALHPDLRSTFPEAFRTARSVEHLPEAVGNFVELEDRDIAPTSKIQLDPDLLRELAELAFAVGPPGPGRDTRRYRPTRPQTIGYSVSDSPAGLAAWIGEKQWTWADQDGGGLTRDQMLDTLHLYWLTALRHPRPDCTGRASRT